MPIPCQWVPEPDRVVSAALGSLSHEVLVSQAARRREEKSALISRTMTRFLVLLMSHGSQSQSIPCLHTWVHLQPPSHPWSPVAPVLFCLGCCSWHPFFYFPSHQQAFTFCLPTFPGQVVLCAVQRQGGDLSFSSNRHWL